MVETYFIWFNDANFRLKNRKSEAPRPWVGIRNISDYSPFGVLLKERTVESEFFRRGFQGQERDDEVKGDGNSVNFKYRMHNPRVGRFFAVDQLTAKYAYNSPYAFSENKLIHLVELEGLETSKPLHFYASVGVSLALKNPTAVAISANAGLSYVPMNGFALTASFSSSVKATSSNKGKASITGSVSGSAVAEFGTGAGNFAGNNINSQSELGSNDFAPPTGFKNSGSIGLGVQGEIVGSTNRFGPSGSDLYTVYKASLVQAPLPLEYTGDFSGSFSSTVINGSVLYARPWRDSGPASLYNASVSISKSSYTPSNSGFSAAPTYNRSIDQKYNLGFSATKKPGGMFSNFQELNFNLTSGGNSLSTNIPNLLSLNLNYSLNNKIGTTNTKGTTLSVGYGASTISNDQIVTP